MPRIMFSYPDGKSTYGFFVDENNDPYFEFLNKRFEVKDIAATGAVAIVNTPELLRRFNEIGMPSRPSDKQYTVTISCMRETQERIKAAAKKEGKSVSKIVEGLITDWLDEKGY